VTTTVEASSGLDPDAAPEWKRPGGGRLAGLRRKVLRPVVIIPVVVVVVAATWWAVHSSSSSSSQTGPVQRVVAVTAGTMSQTVSTTGTLAPADSENLSFSTSGQVTAVNVKAGQQVAKGAVLATLDSAALQSQVTGAQASVDSATAKLSSDEGNNSSAAQVQSDQANLAAAQAQLASAQSSLSGATLTAPIDGTVAAVNLTVGQQLSGTGASGTNLSGSATGSGRTSAASGSGTSGLGGGGGGSGAASSSASSSSSSSSSTPQIQMISTGAYVVNVSVDDTQIGQIAVGQAVTVTPSSSPAAGGGRGGGFARFFGGGGAAAQNNTSTTVDNSQAQAGQAALGTASQTASATGTVTSVGAIATNTSGVAQFPVVVTLSNTPPGFFAGSTVNVAITYNQLTNVLQVPTLALTRSNGATSVTVSQNGTRTQRAVTTGITSAGFTQITSGLTRGDLVVVTIPTQVANNSNANRTGGTGGGGGFGGGGGIRGGGGGGGFRGGGGD
jgi:membrane fusion protein, macrolide-specific efflux system